MPKRAKSPGQQTLDYSPLAIALPPLLSRHSSVCANGASIVALANPLSSFLREIAAVSSKAETVDGLNRMSLAIG
jgi:hypothetical protein